MSDNYIYIKNLKMVFATEILFEVALESWPEWDLNPLIYTHTYISKIKNSVCLHVVIVLQFSADRTKHKQGQIWKQL